jgi:DNA-directed RNA polymerase specialized sigma24 family protein
MSPPQRSSPEMPWPILEDSYVDEFGPIDPNVYSLAAGLWPLATRAILRTIQDLQVGQKLMVKAVAIVSRKLDEQPEKLTNPQAYLFRVFSNLVSEEREKTAKHGQLDMGLLVPSVGLAADSSESVLCRTILVHEILRRADPWTREVFELCILGHTFQEIGRKYGMRANHVRSKWSKQIAKLTDRIQAETKAAEKAALQRRRPEPESF